MNGPERPWSERHLHIIGIAGAGMSGLALLAHALGARITGSDRAESPYLEPLRGEGIEPAIGEHRAENVPDDADVYFSTAIAADNPERVVARERGQPEHGRAVLLGELAERKRVLAVAGTHGKTTTASMVALALRGSGMEAGYLVGGTLRATGRNAEWGDGEWLVVEADESDRSLLVLRPSIAVVLNVELDHHATFGSRLEVEEVFREFIARSERAVLGDAAELIALSGDGVPVTAVSAPDAELDASGSRFQWREQRVAIGAPGAHNAFNAAVALEAASLAGADPARAAAALASFTGAGRRFERLGETTSGAAVFDDYAHHPTELRATLQAARTLRPGRLVAVFQPHLYSRTAALAPAFGAALAEADVICVTDVYRARERPEDFPGIDGHLVASAAADAASGRRVAWLPTLDDAERFLSAELRQGDLCVTLGAGDIDRLGRRLIAEARR